MAEYAHPDSLVSTQWVAEHGSDSNVRLVEVDVDTSAYEQGHIAGAVGWNWQSQLQQTVRRDLISKEELERLLGNSGIDNNTTVVLYGDNNNWFAAWAFWQIRYYGHSNVRLMNGGRVKWVAENRPLTTEAPSHSSKSFRASEPNENIRAYRIRFWRRSTPPTYPWWMCGPPRSLAAICWCRPTCPRRAPSGRTHTRGCQYPLGSGGPGRWHIQVCRRATGSVRWKGHRR